MKFTSTIVALALAVGAIASPVAVPVAEEEKRGLISGLLGGSSTSSNPSASVFKATPIIGCLQPFQAAAIVKAFVWLLANPTSPAFANTANALLASDFTDTSDSINQITGAPEGSVTFSSPAAFIAGSGSQPPLIVSTLGTFNGCSDISWRWISTKGAGNDATPVKGIDAFHINSKGQIEAVYAEFNSGAFLANLGNPECSS